MRISATRHPGSSDRPNRLEYGRGSRCTEPSIHGARDSNVYALDPATDQKRWVYSNEGSWVIASPIVQAGKVYFAASDSALFDVLDARTGARLDSIKFQWPIFASPAIAGNLLYLTGQDGKLVAIDLRTCPKTRCIGARVGGRRRYGSWFRQIHGVLRSLWITVATSSARRRCVRRSSVWAALETDAAQYV